jgi:hypothetical protein
MILKGAILEKEKDFYTYMDKVFTSIDDEQLNYNWLITNYECNDYPDSKIPYNQDYVWISGKELTEIVTSSKIQFIWGVFSGFKKDVLFNDVLKYPMPYADGNPSFWTKDFNIQHPLAEVEIVLWDSALVLLLSKRDYIAETFMKNLHLAEDLMAYNTR